MAESGCGGGRLVAKEEGDLLVLVLSEYTLG